MPEPPANFSWSPRVSRGKILALYHSEAMGLLDEALVEDVYLTITLRCRDILAVGDARNGKVTCHGCRGVFLLEPDVNEAKNRGRQTENPTPIECPACGWQTTWGRYVRSFHKKQLVAGGSDPHVRAFLEQQPRARTARDKMLAIDLLIHQFHLHLNLYPSRPVGVNVIEGDMGQVIRLIEALAFEDIRDPEIRRRCLEWKERWVNRLACPQT